MVAVIRSACGTCHYCGCTVYPVGSAEVRANPWIQRSMDHVLPASHGHGRGPNLVTACRGCNEIKGVHPVRLFKYFMRQTTEKTVPRKRLAFDQFCYELAEFGFIVSIAHINWMREKEAETAAPPRDSRGRFTASDLRMSRRSKAPAMNGEASA